MTINFDKFVNDFYKLTVDEQLKELDKLTEEVVVKLPKVKEGLNLYDDRSSELYQMNPSSLRVSTKAWKYEIMTSGGKSINVSRYIKQLLRYTRPLNEIIREHLDTLWNNFYEHALVSINDIDAKQKFEDIVASMTPEEKDGFVRSKFYRDYGEYASEGMIELETNIGISLQQIKLEQYLESVREGYVSEYKQTKTNFDQFFQSDEK